jgi:hypothetical protein
VLVVSITRSYVVYGKDECCCLSDGIVTVLVLLVCLIRCSGICTCVLGYDNI